MSFNRRPEDKRRLIRQRKHQLVVEGSRQPGRHCAWHEGPHSDQIPGQRGTRLHPSGHVHTNRLKPQKLYIYIYVIVTIIVVGYLWAVFRLRERNLRTKTHRRSGKRHALFPDFYFIFVYLVIISGSRPPHMWYFKIIILNV